MSQDALTKWIRIARTGTFTDSHGREHSFTEQDFDAIKAGYEPKEQEAALCFGHPKDSDPAYGWVKELKREGGNLFARFARVPAQVRQLVDDGHYRYVSMSLSPDKKRLLHVGLLGAAAPAIAGLGPVSFSEADDVTINFSAQAESNDGGSMEELQKQVIELQRQLAELQAAYEKLKGEKGEADSGKAAAEKQAAEAVAEFAAFKGKMATAIYVIMGWIVVVAFYPLLKAVSTGAFLLLLAGGLCDTAGAVIYALKRPWLNMPSLGFHEIFHIFVLLGSAFHLLFILTLLPD